MCACMCVKIKKRVLRFVALFAFKSQSSHVPLNMECGVIGGFITSASS